MANEKKKLVEKKTKKKLGMGLSSLLVKDVTIPTGSSLEVLSGSKVILEAGDKIQIDCSVADKLSGTLSVMEIT